MIPKECKRLAEVDFPIAVVSKHAAREKSIRHGHPSTLHLWWARRPLGACRAMLLGLLLPDPCDPYCPAEFKEAARTTLQELLGVREGDEGLRRALITFIGDVANWDVANHPRWIAVARELVRAAHGDEPPLVVDPFAGGGSIPLEALRLGCDTFASDLNPVACLILKVLLEEIPRHGSELTAELRQVGSEVKKAVERELGKFYPIDPDGAKPIAYLWARTVRCEAPNCGAEIPLLRSFWLCKKASRKYALRYKVVRENSRLPQVDFDLIEPQADREVQAGTVAGAKATCLCCNMVLPADRVRVQLREQRGGADVLFDESGNRIGGAGLLAVVTLIPGEPGRQYRLPVERDYEVVREALRALAEASAEELPNGLTPVPDEPIIQAKVAKNSPFRFHLYGCDSFGQVSNARQKLLMTTIAKHVRTQHNGNSPVRRCLSILVDRLANANTSLCRWDNTRESLQGMYSRQAISMVWDFCEGSPFAEATGGFDGALEWILNVVEGLAVANLAIGQVQQVDAIDSPLADFSANVWFTDPPYYDAVSYADLSDFFFTWLKRTHYNRLLLQDPHDVNNPLTPKEREIIQDDAKQVNGRPKDRTFFEEMMARAFAEGRRVLQDDGIGCVVFAHKTTEGWEALLSGLIRGGWVITGSWPIATEMGARLRARESAALATSVHLVCRPRPENTPVGDWGEVLHELPNQVGDCVEHLQSERVRGADLVFACIGPALEIFSRYAKVETAEGHEVRLPEFLEKIWEVVGRTALEQILGTAEVTARNSTAGALEEDARLTALFLWTLQSTEIEVLKNGRDETEEDAAEDEDDEDAISLPKQKGFSLIFDVARRFAQPLGIHLDQWEGRIIETRKGVVRLLSVTDRAKQLFGNEGAEAIADQLERNSEGTVQLALFPESAAGSAPGIRGRRRRTKGVAGTSEAPLTVQREATTLDRIHAAMLLQASGRASALRGLLKAEQDRGPDFLRLANALSALYPKGSEEKRLLDAMLLIVPR